MKILLLPILLLVSFFAHSQCANNILNYTEEFDNVYWAKSNVTITANHEGIAERMTDDATSGTHRITSETRPKNAVSEVYTLSIKVKNIDAAGINIGISGNGVVHMTYNFSTNSFPAGGTAMNAGFSNLSGEIGAADGDGYRRISITVTMDTYGFITAYFGIANASHASNYVGSGQSVLIKEAQLVKGSDIGVYTKIPATGTTIFKDPLPFITGTYTTLATINWISYVNSTATLETSTDAVLTNATGSGTGVSVNAYSPEVNTTTGYITLQNVSRTITLTYTDKYSISMTDKKIASASFYIGHSTSTANTTLAVRVGTQWYVHRTLFNNNEGALSLPTKYCELQLFNGDDWYEIAFVAGTSMSKGNTLVALPAGNISAIGFWDQRSTASTSARRYDDLDIKLSDCGSTASTQKGLPFIFFQ